MGSSLEVKVLWGQTVVRHADDPFTRDGGAARQTQFDVNVGMVGIDVPVPVPVAFYSFGGSKASLRMNRSTPPTEPHLSTLALSRPPDPPSTVWQARSPTAQIVSL